MYIQFVFSHYGYFSLCRLAEQFGCAGIVNCEPRAMASTSSSTTVSSYNNNRPPLPLDEQFYSPFPSTCNCPDQKETVQHVSWKPTNPLRRFTVCPNRFKDVKELQKCKLCKCSLFEWNDTPLTDFQKSMWFRLKGMVQSLENQVQSLEDQVARLEAEAALMVDLQQQKDKIIAKLEATVADKPKEKAKKVKKVKKICCFPISVVVFSLGVFLIAWWLKLNGSPCWRSLKAQGLMLSP